LAIPALPERTNRARLQTRAPCFFRHLL